MPDKEGSLNESGIQHETLKNDLDLITPASAERLATKVVTDTAGSGLPPSNHLNDCYTPSPSNLDTLSHGPNSPPGGDQALTNTSNQPASPDDSKPIKKKKRKMSRNRCRWLCVTWCLTWWVPSVFLAFCGRMRSRRVRMAWREKVAICILFFLLSCSMLFLLIGFGPIICPKQNAFTSLELNDLTQYVYAYGRVYTVDPIMQTHKAGYAIEPYMFQSLLGKDVSSLFYKQNLFEQYCPGLEVPDPSWDSLANRPKTPAYSHKAIDPLTGFQKQYLEYMNQYAVARVVWPLDYIKKASSPLKKMIVIGSNVYDVSSYFNSQVKFLGPLVESLFANFYGRDATSQWRQILQQDENASLYMNCINNLFYIGQLDQRQSFRCMLQDYILLTFTALLCFVIVVKFFAAIRCVGDANPEDCDRYVLVNVPVYSEGIESLTATLESIASTRYDDTKKFMFIVCDGIVKGSGNDLATPSLLLNILNPNADAEPNDTQFEYEALGEESEDMINRAKVYTGYYEPFLGKSVPYILVVKVGNEGEKSSPGNRGKRDSQLILLRFLSRCHFDSDLSPLELEMRTRFDVDFGVDPNFFEYLLFVDADTTLSLDSINHLVSSCVHDQAIVGLCGTTEIANDQDTFVTMIQTYEYAVSHSIAKAFESLFNSVTCLPGCFSMYRLRSLKGRPLIISPLVLKAYSRERINTLRMKNLLSLGEDRYLTTLMLKHFPNMKTSFNPRAKCKTIVPDQWPVLLSQRRRWINSTIMNLFELLSLKQLCGCCCFGMRFVIFMDLISTILQPAGILYIGYLVYTLVTQQNSFPLISVLMIAGAYGLQVMIFISKREWAMVGWMLVYLLALPMFGLYLPLYSFWHFDDFRWGKTRSIDEEQDWEDDSLRKAIPKAKFTSATTVAPLQKSPGASQSVDSRVRNWQVQSMESWSDNGANAGTPLINPQLLITKQPRMHPMSSSTSSLSKGRVRKTPSQTSQSEQLSLSSTPPAFIPNEDDILVELRALLNDVNLTQVSRKEIRKRLEGIFKCDLTEKRDFINQSINSILKL